MDAPRAVVPPSSPAASSPQPKFWSPLLQWSLAFVLGGFTLLLLQYTLKKFTSGQPSEFVRHEAFRIDLNTADRATLMQLPRIGPHRAESIVEKRTQRGGFNDVGDLKAVKGVGNATIERVRSRVEVGQKALREERTMESPFANDSMGQSGPRSGPPVARKTPPQVPIDLNRSTREDLLRLPGIGATLADRIIADRRTRGPFRHVEDITRVSGIKGKTLEKLLPYICVEALGDALDSADGGQSP